MSRRYLAPEVVQTSAMDCGPAALTSLLNGFGVRVSYGRLREACQTDVDGTSIDTLETVANRLGLACEQIMLPVDHLLLDESSAFPAIVVTEHLPGQTHFVVAWRRHGRLVQVMDPAVGRRWMRSSQFLHDLYVHTQRVPANAIEEWLRSADFQKVLTRRMRDLGLRTDSQTLLDHAGTEPGWRGLAALDAAIRLTASLVAAGGVRAGQQATDIIAALWKRALTDDKMIPVSFWFVRPFVVPPEGGTTNEVEEQVLIRGAVLVRALGPQVNASGADPLSPELSAALTDPAPRPWRAVRGILGVGASWTMLALALLVCVVAGLSLLETVILRSFIDLGRDLGLIEQRVIALGLILGIGVIELLLEFRLVSGLLRLGRQLEIRFRLTFSNKLSQLNDRYFHSRPVSDMAERSHAIQRLRELPRLFGQITQTSVMVVLTAAAIALFDPASAPLALLAAGMSLALPFAFRPWIEEADMRVRTHSGSLSRFYFDALQGLTTIKAHAAERVIQREQEGMLVEWMQAAGKHLTIVLLLDGLQMVTGFGLAALLLVRHVHALADTGGALLLAYWALSLPELGGNLAVLVRQYPWQRNTLLRLLEPLTAPDSGDPVPQALDVQKRGRAHAAPCSFGVRIQLSRVSVIAAGQSILQEISLDIAAGSHVAVVGPSGAGKSSLIGVLLGWHRAAHGDVCVDGTLLDAARLDQLRRETSWVDPAVQLWNQSLADNLRYGHGGVNAEQLGTACSQADLIDVLEKLPDGLQTVLGESGGLLSGGQGQRVRLGRAMLQSDARLVCLDEPFRGLGHGQRRELALRVRAHFKLATLLFVSHDVSDTLGFDRVLVIDGGRVVEDDTPGALSAKTGSLYRRLLDAEESVRRDVWNSPTWRRLRIDEGRLTEEVVAS